MLKYLQILGRSLMLPIAVLPIAAIMVRLGDPAVLDWSIMFSAGGSIFDALPILFSLGVAIGIARNNDGAAALSAMVGYLVLSNSVKILDPDINLGVLGGIIVGVVAGMLYNRFYNIRLPDFLNFFGGKRFVPILTGLSCLLLGVIFGFTWMYLQNGLDFIGHLLIEMGAVGVFIYGVLNRLLIPFGLHHVLNTIVWFEFGSFVTPAGEIINGDIHRFFAGDPEAGIFMAGFFPVMMFGLLGACLAMYTTAKKENKKMVFGILFSMAFASFLTGITEPIEFSFMFLAPVLYLIHALLTGLMLSLAYVLEFKTGFAFSAGLVDFILSFKQATNPMLLFPLGALAFVVYYTLFHFFIIKFNLETPGRDNIKNAHVALSRSNSDFKILAQSYVDSLGGLSNIDKMDACATRIRLELDDISLIKEDELKALGAKGIIKVGKNGVQVIVGLQAENILSEMREF